MAKRKTMNEEERKIVNMNRELEECKQRQNFSGIPTYSFNVGDTVYIGNLIDVKILEKISDYIYKIGFSIEHNNYGKPYIETGCERYVNWFDIRPSSKLSQSIIKNENVRLDFVTSSIGGLINSYYFFGIDMNPEYQRDFVWSDEDKQALLSSIFSNVEIGKFALVDRESIDVAYEILDGKQRLKTIIDFYENRISYNGIYYNDLCRKDQNFFKSFFIQIAKVRNADKKDVLNYFVMLNKGGKAVDKEHLRRVEKMITE